MRQAKTLDQILDIVKHTAIRNYDAFKMFGKNYAVGQKTPHSEWPLHPQEFGKNTTDELSQKERFSRLLADTIYHNFYSRGTLQQADPSVNPEVVPGYQNRKSVFIDNLKKANHSTKIIDPFWTITGFQGERAVIQKNDNIKFLIPNTYILQRNDRPMQIGDKVHLKERNSDATIQPVFFYIFGNTPLQDSLEILRFYFNIKAENATELVSAVSETFNHYHIPFSFKCLNETAWYTRADNAVLYVDKRYHGIAGKLIQLIYNRVYPHLNKPTPLFTLKLANGLGFAEDPGYGKSFGHERCRIIAKLLIDKFENNLDLSPKKVQASFRANGFNVNRLYLNAFSPMKYQYKIIKPKAK